MSDPLDLLDPIEGCWDLCAPPVFLLPPPPRPPWLEDLDECSEVGLCPNDPIVNAIDTVNGVFHSVITVVVTATVIVISLILLAVFIWRLRRRRLGGLGYLSEKGAEPAQPCGNHSLLQAKRLNHYSNNLVVEAHSGKADLPTLIIGGVPFQVVRRETVFPSLVAESSLVPIYETIEDNQGEERVYAQLENLCDNCDCSARTEAAVFSLASEANQRTVIHSREAGRSAEAGEVGLTGVGRPARSGLSFSPSISYRGSLKLGSSRASSISGRRVPEKEEEAYSEPVYHSTPKFTSSVNRRRREVEKQAAPVPFLEVFAKNGALHTKILPES